MELELKKFTNANGEINYEVWQNGKYLPDTIVWGGYADSSDEYKQQQLQKAINIFNNCKTNPYRISETLLTHTF
jgi:hypothetical protein